MKDTSKNLVTIYPYGKNHNELQQNSRSIYVVEEQLEHGSDLFTDAELSGDHRRADRVLEIVTELIVKLDNLKNRRAALLATN